jgi:capsular polysaccharide biosynthesis protein
MLGESYGSLIRLLGWGAAVEETILPTTTRIGRTVIVLPDTGYYHWLLEVLPAALHCLQAEPAAAILTSTHPAPYVEQALKLISPPGGVIRSSMPVAVDRLILAAIDPYSGFVPREDVVILQKQILPLAPSQAHEKLIYISRRGSNRSPANELEVEGKLELLGFKSVNPETMPFSSQVELFRSASVIVGVHGAGMANQIWSTALRGIVEIQTPSHFNDCFARLAVSRGIAYSASMCQPLESGGEVVMVEEVVNAVRDLLPRH